MKSSDPVVTGTDGWNSSRDLIDTCAMRSQWPVHTATKVSECIWTIEEKSFFCFLQDCCWKHDKTFSATWNRHVSGDFNPTRAVCSVKQTTWSPGQKGCTDHNLILWYSVVWVSCVSAQTLEPLNSSWLLPWCAASSGFMTCRQNIWPVRMRLLCIHGDEGADRVATSTTLKFPATIIMFRSTWGASCNSGSHSCGAAKWKYALDVCAVCRPAKPLKPWQGKFTWEDQPCWQHRT